MTPPANRVQLRSSPQNRTTGVWGRVGGLFAEGRQAWGVCGLCVTSSKESSAS